MSWKIVQLKEVATVSAGNSAPQADALFESGTFNFYRTSDVGRIRKGVISDSLDKLNNEGIKGLKKFEVGTILFPKSGASTFLNHRVMLEKDGYVSSHLAGIKAKNEVLNDRYLFYYLTTIDAKNLVQDSNYPSLKTTSIEKIQFKLPPLEIQEKLVMKLDALFIEIDKATIAAKANIKNAEALFQSHLKEVFDSRDEDYKEFQLGDICKIIGGGTPSKTNPKFYEGDIPWATVRDMTGDVIRDTDYKINVHAVSQSSTNIIPRNNVVIATRVGLGKVCIIENDTAINQDLRGIIPLKPNLIEVMYLFYWFKSIAKVIIDAGRGATVHGVTLPFVKALKIKVPDIAKQKTIISKVQDIQSNIDILNLATNKKIKELQLLKESILQKAFNGELVEE